MNTLRPLPNVDDPLYAPHFEGLKHKQVLVQHCSSCEHKQWPPRERCFSCHGDRFEWKPIEPRGEVFTYMVANRAFDPYFKDRLPYGIVVADLGDGIRILAAYADVDVDELECGVAVQAYFERVNDAVTVLKWERRPTV